MKKLMIGLVGAAAMVACAEVQSGNIVGFEERSLEKGKQIVTGANFVTVGEDALDIQSIKMDDSTVDGGAMIWWWNTSTGKYDAKANWFTELYADEDGEVTLGIAGWGDGLYWMPINKTFSPGESFWIQANKNSTVTLSGEVNVIDANAQYCGIDLVKGKQVQLANPFPCEIDIQDIKMDESTVDGGAMIWWWNTETGKYDAKANWFTELYADEDGEITLGRAGWGDGLYWMPISKTFESGSGFWIQSNKDALVQFPNPFYVAE